MNSYFYINKMPSQGERTLHLKMRKMSFPRCLLPGSDAQIRVRLEQKVLLTYIHLRLMHSPKTGIVKSLSWPPGHTLNNLNRGRRLQVWQLRQSGDLHSKFIARIISYEHLIVLFKAMLLGSSCPPGRIMFFLIGVQRS